MILSKFIKRLGVGGKVILPASASGGPATSNRSSTATASKSQQRPSSSSSSSTASRTGSDLSLKRNSLPTIVEEENDQDRHNRIPSQEEDEGELSTLSQSSPPQNLSRITAALRGMSPDLDAILVGFERVQEIVWACLDNEQEITIQFNSLDPSTVPPPDVRNLESIVPVEALLKAMIRTKDFERKFKRDHNCEEICERAIAKVNQMSLHEKDKHAKEFILHALKLLMDVSSTRGAFDEEILIRLSSVIRFHLRLALNARKNFSPIVLSRQAKAYYDSQIPNGDVVDLPHPELNVAALFHQALQLMEASIDPEAGSSMAAHEALKLRSARKFISNVLACAKRIEGVDEKRRKAWQSAQRWACDIQRLFAREGELQDLALLADLRELQAIADTDTAISQDLLLLELHRESLKERRSSSTNASSAKELRLLRTQMTGMCGRNGHFPEIVFILDA